MARVALWGAYRQKNFGDDLMAIVFAQAIREAGHEVQILDLDDVETADYGFAKSFSAQDVFKGVAGVVLGGGAVLKDAQYVRAFVSPVARRIEISYYNLGKSLKRGSLPLLPISIGSDGLSSVSKASVFRRHVLSSDNCRIASIRLRTDLKLMKELNVNAQFYPDILFSTSVIFPRPPRIRTGDPERFFLNLHKSKSNDGRRIIKSIKARYPNAVIFVGSSHLKNSPVNYEWVPESDDGVVVCQYEGTRKFLDLLSSMDIVISSKLHLGICAATYGAVFISLDGRGKVRAQLEAIGISSAYLTSKVLEDGNMNTLFDNYQSLQADYAKAIGKCQAESQGHLKLLANWLDEL